MAIEAFRIELHLFFVRQLQLVGREAALVVPSVAVETAQLAAADARDAVARLDGDGRVADAEREQALDDALAEALGRLGHLGALAQGDAQQQPRALLDDLEQRGLLQDTLVITLAEFGRTPGINASLGRDHFASAWSTSLSGCGIKGGMVFGKTDDDGHKVADGEVGAPELFATIFQALGINPQKNYYVGSRPVPLTEPNTKPIMDVLA